MLLAQLRQSPRCVDSPAVVEFVQTVVSLLDSSPYALSVVRPPFTDSYTFSGSVS